MLNVVDVHSGYGVTPVLFGVSLTVGRGEAVALLGRNGMGKTTLLRTIMGTLTPTRGRIDLAGDDLTGRPPYEIARAGVAYVPESRRIFPGLTVRENLDLGLSALSSRPAARCAERLELVFSHFPILRERMNQSGQTLSGGEQQMLAIGRAMMSAPRLVLMDEPTLGLAPSYVRHIAGMVTELTRLGVTVFLVEQNARVALEVCDRGYIMEKGAVVFEGTAGELRDSPVTREKLGV